MNKSFVKALASIGLSSSVVTILINLIPDTIITTPNGTQVDNHIGLKILLFIIFGLLIFGISWTKNNINNLLNGLVTGFIVGVGTGICLGAIDNSLAKMADFSGTPNYNLLLSFKWIIPIVVNTFWGSIPWKGDSYT